MIQVVPAANTWGGVLSTIQPKSQENATMAASLKTVREKMDVEQTKDNKGLTCTLCVTAYDNGLISLNGRPVSSVPVDPALSWLQASEVISIALTEFYRQVSKRAQQRHAD
jgi:hypothetical protein